MAINNLQQQGRTATSNNNVECLRTLCNLQQQCCVSQDTMQPPTAMLSGLGLTPVHPKLHRHHTTQRNIPPGLLMLKTPRHTCPHLLVSLSLEGSGSVVLLQRLQHTHPRLHLVSRGGREEEGAALCVHLKHVRLGTAGEKEQRINDWLTVTQMTQGSTSSLATSDVCHQNFKSLSTVLTPILGCMCL